MKKIVAWFVKNPVAANLMMVLMFVMGVFGYFNLEREFIPTASVNSMSVSISWPGASPRDVEEQLIVRIEEAVDGLDGIDYIESTASEGDGTITIWTKLGIDYEKLLDQVQSRVDSVQNLPSDSFRPQLTRTDIRHSIAFLTLYGDTDRLTIQRAANDLRQKLTQLDGLQLTKQATKVPEQVTIEVSEQNLQRYNLTFNQVAAAIRNSSVNQSAGVVETSGGNLQLRTRSLANSSDEFDNIIVRQTPEGGTVRVRDIAVVKDEFQEDEFSATFRGKPAAIFEVESPDELNITQAGEAVRKFEKDIQNNLPPGFGLSLIHI